MSAARPAAPARSARDENRAERAQRVDFYAERVAAGLAPFTGEEPGPVRSVAWLAGFLSEEELAELGAE